MTVYIVTTANWNNPSFWAAISETAGGHSPHFDSLPVNFSVTFDAASSTTTISDATTTLTIGEPGTTGTNANLGGSTDWSFFTEVLGSQADESLTGGLGMTRSAPKRPTLAR